MKNNEKFMHRQMLQVIKLVLFLLVMAMSATACGSSISVDDTSVEITVRIDIWQGEVDKNVPVNQGSYQNELLPNSRLTVLPGQAHLYILEQWREILSVLVG